MKNIKNIIILVISIILPLGLEISPLKSSLGGSALVYSALWILTNYLFITMIVELMTGFMDISKLKDKKIKTGAYLGLILVYFSFTAFVNLYFTKYIYFQKDDFLNIMLSPILIILIFMGYVFVIQLGIYPDVEEKETKIYTVPQKGSYKNGRERLGTLVGTYAEGFILGYLVFKYEDIKSVSSSKGKDEVVIKGKDEKGPFRININAKRTANDLKSILVSARDKGLIDRSKINIK